MVERYVGIHNRPSYYRTITRCSCTRFSRPQVVTKRWKMWISSRAADWTGRLYVLRTSLRSPPSLQTSFERVHWCIHIFLGQTVPMVDDTLWEELKTGFAVTMILQQFPAVREPVTSHTCACGRIISSQEY